MSAQKIFLENYTVHPLGLVVIHAEEERWEDIRMDLLEVTDPKLKGTFVLFLEPGERLDSLSESELAAYGLKKI